MDLTSDELINSIKSLPLQFNPNDKYEYSNSGYLILGYIIEKITGLKYEEYVQVNIFNKLGMKYSYYDNNLKIIPNRAKGYSNYEGNIMNAEYLSPSFANSAGSLLSTVEDMFIWNKSIQNNTLISNESKEMAFTNYKLNNNKNVNYGYGWAINEIDGLKSIEHNGGINGFSSSEKSIPEKNLYAIILSNLDDGEGPENYVLQVISCMSNKLMNNKKVIKLSEKQLRKWEGIYQFDEIIREIKYDDGYLYSTREGGFPFRLLPISENEFMFENQITHYVFSKNKGKKQVLYLDRIEKNVGVEIENKLEKDKSFISLTNDVLEKYVGVYEIQSNFKIEIKIVNKLLYASTEGQQPVTQNALNEKLFYITEINSQIEFIVNSEGKTTSLVFTQGDAKMEGKRL